MDFLSIGLNVLYYIVFPIFFILQSILSILIIVAAPLLHLVHYFSYACYSPIYILKKFETLYVFLGVAVLVGVVTGTSLHYVSGFIVSVLDLEGRVEEARGRTLASYREEKREKQKNDPALKPGYYGLKGTRGNDVKAERRDPDFHQNPLSLPKLRSRRDKDLLKEEPMDFEWSKPGRGRAKNDLVPNTILEEDSTEDGY